MLSRLKATLLVIVLGTIGLWYGYGLYIQHPGLKFNDHGDGYKNYYTVEYHVLYDSIAWHFEGMNYPYGDNVVFTDNQPTLSNTLRFIHQHHIANLDERVVPIMNLLMIFGILIDALLLCLILMEFEVVWWFAALAAAGIAFLAPQLIRFAGHYALAYSFYIPLVWWLWIRYFKRPRIWLSLLICLVVVAASFVHLYYLPMAVFFGLALWIHQYLTQRPRLATALLNAFVQVILPLILVKIWLGISDPITDRPALPYGFMDYRAFWEGVFLPVGMQIGNTISRFIMPIRPLNIENISYVGLAAFFCMGALLFLFFKNMFKGFKGKNLPLRNALLNGSFTAGFVILLFSLGLPIMIHPQWLKYFGLLQQFRSVGRFAWVFYYTLNVYAFAWCYHLWKTAAKQPAWLYILLPLGLILYDNFQFNRQLDNNPDINVHKRSVLLFHPQDYQAILPIPYFFYGGEGIGVDDSCDNFKPAEELSTQTGLPLVASNMSRTSAAEARNNIRFAKNDSLPISVINAYPNQKPLLIVQGTNCVMGQREKDIIAKAIYIGSQDAQKFYALSLDSIRQLNRTIENNYPGRCKK